MIRIQASINSITCGDDYTLVMSTRIVRGDNLCTLRSYGVFDLKWLFSEMIDAWLLGIQLLHFIYQRIAPFAGYSWNELNRPLAWFFFVNNYNWLVIQMLPRYGAITVSKRCIGKHVTSRREVYRQKHSVFANSVIKAFNDRPFFTHWYI